MPIMLRGILPPLIKTLLLSSFEKEDERLIRLQLSAVRFQTTPPTDTSLLSLPAGREGRNILEIHKYVYTPKNGNTGAWMLAFVSMTVRRDKERRWETMT
jgi:hypothetical protein